MEFIFMDIVDIMHNDYSGCIDKKGWDNPKFYLKKIKELKEKGQLNRETFFEIVKEYLIDFKDLHIFFKDLSSQTKKTRGFQVRRFEDRLYITHSDVEMLIERGMSFISLGGYSIPDLKERHSRLLNEQNAERENWTQILSLYEYGEIEDKNGVIKEIPLHFYEKPPYIPEYSIKELDEKTLLLTFTDFMNPDAITALMAENLEALETAERWIIDVRVNNGGSDASYYPLLPYIMPAEGVELADKEDKMLFNCTLSNAKREINELESIMENIQDEQALSILKIFKKEWEKNKGKGFVEFDFTDVMPETFIKGKILPQSIVVLADYMCGSAGDSFVEVCKKSRKVTIIGRATMGLNDYANLTSEKWQEGFELLYPTSRLSRIDKGQGMTGKGIEPHIHIPWTPNHLKADVDMEKTLKFLSEKALSYK